MSRSTTEPSGPRLRSCSSPPRPTGSGGQRGRWLAAVLALTMAAAACGGGRSDSGAGDDGSSDTSAVGQPSAEAFGDLASPCGPVDGEANDGFIVVGDCDGDALAAHLSRFGG